MNTNIYIYIYIYIYICNNYHNNNIVVFTSIKNIYIAFIIIITVKMKIIMIGGLYIKQ